MPEPPPFVTLLPRVRETSLSLRSSHIALRYGTALLLFGVVCGLTYVFREPLRSQPSVPFFAVVALTAFLAGFGPSMLATALSVLAIELLFFEPPGTLGFHDVQDVTALLVFGGVGLLVSWLAHRSERSRQELAAQRKAAEETTRKMQLLSEAGRLMIEAERYEDGLQDVAELLCRDLADYTVAYSAERDGFIRRVAVAHRDPGKRDLVQRLLHLRRPHVEDELGIGAVVRTGEPVLTGEVPADLLERAAAGNGEYLQLLRELDPVSSIIVPLRSRGRTVGGLALASTSRSGRRYDEEDLELVRELAGRLAVMLDNARLLQEAQAAVRTRDRVMAVVAHDLRSPLHMVSVAAELLARPDEEPGNPRIAEMLKRASRQGGELIEDLLDLSRMETGDFRISPEVVKAEELIDAAEQTARLLAEEKPVRVSVDASLRGAVRADRSRIQQVFSNLLENAFKFSPPDGHVRLSARSVGAEVVFSVSDDGAGIAEEDLPYVFDHFWQSSSDGRGMGLGLAIVRGIVVAHGGRVWVDSGPGRGTTFHFTLPSGEGEGVAAGEPPSPPPPSPRGGRPARERPSEDRSPAS